MKLAVGTDDQKTIRRGHFGESKYYLIYEILNGEIYSKNWRINPFAAGKEHQHGQAKNIMELLHDCQIFMGRSMGKKSLPQIVAKNIDAIITSIENIEEAVTSYLNGKDEYFKYYNAETGEFCDCVMR